MTKEKIPEQRHKKNAQTCYESRARRTRAAQTQRLEYEASKQKYGEKQTFAKCFAGYFSDLAGHAGKNYCRGQPESQGDKKNGRNLGEACLHYREGASPYERDAYEGKISLNGFGNFHAETASPEVRDKKSLRRRVHVANSEIGVYPHRSQSMSNER
jgi:hypothetical protein